MDIELVDLLVKHARRGSGIFFGRSQTGAVKIKIKHGPFGVMTSRYQTNRETREEIRRLFSEMGLKRA